MSLHHIRERARWMQKELRTLPPDRPATVQDLIEVFTAIEELAREASTVTDPRLYAPADDRARGGR